MNATARSSESNIRWAFLSESMKWLKGLLHEHKARMNQLLFFLPFSFCLRPSTNVQLNFNCIHSTRWVDYFEKMMDSMSSHSISVTLHVIGSNSGMYTLVAKYSTQCYVIGLVWRLTWFHIFPDICWMSHRVGYVSRWLGTAQDRIVRVDDGNSALCITQFHVVYCFVLYQNLFISMVYQELAAHIKKRRCLIWLFHVLYSCQSVWKTLISK